MCSQSLPSPAEWGSCGFAWSEQIPTCRDWQLYRCCVSAQATLHPTSLIRVAQTFPVQDSVSVQASCFSSFFLRATHTAEQHLKPDPKPSCHTRSPFFTPWKVSTYVHAYLQHMVYFTTR